MTSPLALAHLRAMRGRCGRALVGAGACSLLLLSACDVYHPEAFEGYDAGVDASSPDASVRRDAGAVDAGSLDAGSVDSGPLDASAADAQIAEAGAGEAGVSDDAGPDAGAPGDAG